MNTLDLTMNKDYFVPLTKKEMIDLILEKGLFKFEGLGAKYDFQRFCKKTKAELANYYADALVR